MNTIFAITTIAISAMFYIIAGMWMYDGEFIRALLNVIIAVIFSQQLYHIIANMRLQVIMQQNSTIIYQNEVLLKQNMHLIKKQHDEYPTQTL